MNGNNAYWRMTGELLKQGAYERVVDLLNKAGSEQPQANDAPSIDLLSIIQQICRLCQQCRAEIKRYRQAAENASTMEGQLRQQLLEIISRVGRETDPEADDSQAPERAGDLLEAAIAAKVETSAAVARASYESPELKVYCFGSFQVYRNDRLISDWPSLKARAIFKYLMAHKGMAVAKDTLMETFWPGADPEAARRNLHQAIYSLRNTLKQDGSEFQPILFENDCYSLNPDLRIWADYVEFEHQVQGGQWLEKAGRSEEAAAEYDLAEALYRADFLAEDIFEDWTQLQREQLRSSYLALGDWLSEYYFQQGEFSRSARLCRKLLAHDICFEEAHCRLMRCYQAQGQRRLAMQQYQNCVQSLKEELDVPPSAHTERLYQHLFGKAGTFVLSEAEIAAS